MSTRQNKKVTNFVCKIIVYQFDIPYNLIFDIGRQFDNDNFKVFYSSLGIKYHNSSPAHRQANRHVGGVNKIIMTNLKAML